MSKVKNQHLVPQTYLRQFSLDEKFLWAYDKKEKKSFSANINDIATGRYFYDSAELDKIYGDQFLEKLLAELESDYLPALTELKNSNWILNSHVRSYFVRFLTFQLMRTKATRLSMAHMRDSAKDQILAKGGSVEDLEKLGLGEMSQDEKEEHIKYMVNPVVYSEISRDLDSQYWFVSDNQTKWEYFCSDNPFTLYAHREKSISAVEHYIPLTPNKALHLFPAGAFPTLIKLANSLVPISNGDGIKFCNSMQVIQSYRQIYFKRDQFRFAENIMREYPHLGDIDAPKYSVHMFKRFNSADKR
jgi:hypothetical protein